MKKRLLSTFMALLMVCSLVIYLPDSIIVSAASFTPRTTAPSTSNSYYYSSNPFYKSGYGMPNCTCYAYGRAWEILGSKPSLSTGNAGKWYWYNKNNGIYSYGSTPKLGAIACWDKYDENQGHVAVVEAISGDTITISESHYKSTNFDTRNIASNSSNYLTIMRFCGYIYIGEFGIDPIDTPIDNSYEVPCKRTATKKYDVYDRYGNAEYNSSGVRRYIAQNDECTIHEVYGSGYVKVTYPVGSGTHTAYAKNDGWSLTPKPVEAKPTFSILSANKYNYALGENIVFTANSDNNAKFTIGINNENGDRLITRDLPGTLTVSSKELGLGTYYAYVTAYNSAGYVDSSGIWFLVSPQGTAMPSGAGQTIPNGDYVIVSEMNQDLYLDIPGTTVPAENNLVVNINNGHPGKGAEFDVWTVTYLNNGFYKITQKDTKMALDLYDNSLNRGTRTTVRTYSGAASQQWSINETKHGYQIQSRSTGWVLDVVGGNANPGTQTNVWEINDNKAQSWGFVPFASDDRPIPDGEYYIKSALADVWLDAWGNNDDKPFTNGTNIGILDAKSEKFKIEYVADGYYRITELNSGLVLDLANGAVDSYLCIGNNIHLWTGGEKTQRNQLWRIKDEGNGYYTIISKLSGYCIDVQNSVVDNSTNVIQCFYNKSNAQKWSFEKVHKHTATKVAAKAATCTTAGNTAYWYCSGCKKYFSDSACTKEITLASTVVKANGHSFGDWTVTEAATCAAEGTKSRKCTVCGKTETTSIAKATTHSFGSWTTTKAATCAAEGTKTHKCSVCGKTETASIAKTTDHKFGDWTVTKAATCAAEGTKTRKCSICGKTENQTIPKSNKHKYKVETIPPTTTEGGYDRHNCTLCGHFYIDNVVPPISVPNNPTVSYEKGNGSVKLTWNTVSGAQKYGIAGYQNGAWQLLDKTTGSSYTLKNLKAGTNYKVAVIAMFNSNWNMDFSNAITVTPNEATVSQYPVVQTQVKDSKIGFKWNKIPGVEKYGIGMYQANKWKVIKQLDGNVTTWTSPQISSGKYRLAVLAKVNGQWVNADVFKKSFYVTVE